jgi:hypothetical protein
MYEGLRFSLVSLWPLVVCCLGEYLSLVHYAHLTSRCSYDTGTIAGIIAMPYWKKEFSTQPDGVTITAAEDSLIVSILSAVSPDYTSCRYPH